MQCDWQGEDEPCPERSVATVGPLKQRLCREHALSAYEPDPTIWDDAAPPREEEPVGGAGGKQWVRALIQAGLVPVHGEYTTIAACIAYMTERKQALVDAATDARHLREKEDAAPPTAPIELGDGGRDAD